MGRIFSLTKKNTENIIDVYINKLSSNIVYMDNNCSLTSIFSGSYDLLKFIITKYNIYDSKVSILVTGYNYKDKQRWADCPKWWHYQGVPLKVWNLLYKDLTILKLQGNINFNNLEELRDEYERTR